MYPVLFEWHILGRTVAFNSYGLMIGFSLLLWAFLVRREAERQGLQSMADGTSLSLIVLVAALFLGGKGLYLLTRWNDFLEGRVDLGTGFVFWGAILLAAPAMVWRLKALGVPVLKGLDIFALPTPASHALGRIGCFLAGCCYGHRCDQPWAVTFHDGVGLRGVPLHPVQLYEAFLLMALFSVLWFRTRLRKTFHGQVLCTYFIGYAILRCITESLRGDPGRRFVLGGASVGPGDPPEGISVSVFISLVMVVAGLLLYRWCRRRAPLS